MNIYQDDVFASLKTFEFDESKLPPPEKYSVKHLHPMYGVSPSAETRAKQSAKLKGVPQRKGTCPHCGVIAPIGTITKHHGVKCASHTSTS